MAAQAYVFCTPTPAMLGALAEAEKLRTLTSDLFQYHLMLITRTYTKVLHYFLICKMGIILISGGWSKS
jgi:hypothetical protein